VNNKKFCPLPWINISIDVNGSLRPCCRYLQPNAQTNHKLPYIHSASGNLDKHYNSEAWKKLRQAFINGEQPNECNMCWNDEQGGVKSYRETFVETKNIDISKVDFTSDTVDAPLTLDLKLNNVCNLKCRICGSQASSTYAKEYQILWNKELPELEYWTHDKITNTPNEQVISKWAKNIQHIEMTGGEPMTSPENVKVLQLLDKESDLSQKTMLINTNVTHWNKHLINYLTKFKKATICLSIDDVGERQEYHRYPSEWDVILKNVDRFIELRNDYPNIEVILFCTVSNFNVYYLPEYAAWAASKNLFVHYNILHTSEKYCIRNLPTIVKAQLVERLIDFPIIANFVMLPQQEGHWKKFLDELEILDNYRGQNFIDTFPKWSEILGL
jgi:organic radical activating enzyme